MLTANGKRFKKLLCILRYNLCCGPSKVPGKRASPFTGFRKVGCNRAIIYRYFDSKQDLITAVMMTLMHEVTNDIIEKTADSKKVTPKSFTDALYHIVPRLRNDRRYAIVMDAQNIDVFARLTHAYFSVTSQRAPSAV